MGGLNCKNCRNKKINEQTEIQFDTSNINGNENNYDEEKNKLAIVNYEDSKNNENPIETKNGKLKSKKNQFQSQITNEGNETGREERKQSNLTDDKIGKIEINDDKEIKPQLGIIEEIKIIKTEEENTNKETNFKTSPNKVNEINSNNKLNESKNDNDNNNNNNIKSINDNQNNNIKRMNDNNNNDIKIENDNQNNNIKSMNDNNNNDIKIVNENQSNKIINDNKSNNIKNTDNDNNNSNKITIENKKNNIKKKINKSNIITNKSKEKNLSTEKNIQIDSQNVSPIIASYHGEVSRISKLNQLSERIESSQLENSFIQKTINTNLGKIDFGFEENNIENLTKEEKNNFNEAINNLNQFVPPDKKEIKMIEKKLKKMPNIIPLLNLNSEDFLNDENGILFHGELKKLINFEINSKKPKMYSTKFCLLTPKYFKYYKSREQFLRDLNPICTLSLSDISKVNYGKIQINNKVISHFIICNQLGIKKNKNLFVENILDAIENNNLNFVNQDNESLIAFSNDNEDLVIKWYFLIQYFIEKNKDNNIK